MCVIALVVMQYRVSSLKETRRVLRLDEVLKQRVLFAETLHMYNDVGVRCGRFSTSVELDDDCSAEGAVLVHISNKARLNCANCCTTVTGSVTRNLKTLHELRHEYSDLATSKHERVMHLLKETKQYYSSVTSSVCNISTTKHYTIPFSWSSGLIGEASNLVLLRMIAIQGYQGIMSLTTILSNGRRCRNYYVSRQTRQTVNGRPMNVMVVSRNVTNHRKHNLTISCTLTRAGQLVSVFWSNTNSFLHVDPDIAIEPGMVSGKCGPGLELCWTRDVHVHSLYLDRVVQQRAALRSYTEDTQSLYHVVANLVQHILHLRPDDIVRCAISYFKGTSSTSPSEATSTFPEPDPTRQDEHS